MATDATAYLYLTSKEQARVRRRRRGRQRRGRDSWLSSSSPPLSIVGRREYAVILRILLRTGCLYSLFTDHPFLRLVRWATRLPHSPSVCLFDLSPQRCLYPALLLGTFIADCTACCYLCSSAVSDSECYWLWGPLFCLCGSTGSPCLRCTRRQDPARDLG